LRPLDAERRPTVLTFLRAFPWALRHIIALLSAIPPAASVVEPGPKSNFQPDSETSIRCDMPYSTNPVCLPDDHVPARSPKLHAPAHAIQDATPCLRRRSESPSRLWHRRASVIELLVALGIIIFALVFICTARGDETSPSPTLTPEPETRSVAIKSVERAVAANSFVSLSSNRLHSRAQRSVGHYPP
jgi:hypothetical protein